LRGYIARFDCLKDLYQHNENFSELFGKCEIMLNYFHVHSAMGCAPCSGQNFELFQWVWNAGYRDVVLEVDSNIAADVATTFWPADVKIIVLLSRLPKDPSHV